MKRIIFILVVVISFALMGCNVVNRTWTKMSDKYSFENYYVDNGGVLRVNRVLIIPFTNSSDYAAAAKEVMDVFALELNKLNRFEVVNPEENTGAMLPERLAKDGAIEDGDVRSICEAYGTDAVIFGEIKNYEPYKPFVLGIKFSMISADTNRTIWIVDETLDASMKKAANAAKHYYYQQIDSDVYRSGLEVMENSIKMYTQFVCASMVSTINGRE